MHCRSGSRTSGRTCQLLALIWQAQLLKDRYHCIAGNSPVSWPSVGNRRGTFAATYEGYGDGNHYKADGIFHFKNSMLAGATVDLS